MSLTGSSESLVSQEEAPVVAATAARHRSGLYGLLAAVFGREPTRDLVRRLRDAQMKSLLADAGAELGPDVLGPGEDEIREALAIEFARLFLGPGPHVSPYASVHIDSESASLWGPTTAWVKSFIEGVGFKYAANYRDLPDHIGIELDFMQRLAAAEADALETGARSQVEDVREAQRDFVLRHLAQWVPDFCDQVIAEADLSFFREIARLTKTFVLSEREEFVRRFPRLR